MTKASILLVFLIMVCVGSGVQAASLKNSEFLKYTEGQRHWCFLGAFTSLGHVAFLEDQEKGKCVWNWLYDKDEDRKAFLLESFRKFPDHTPTSILIAVLRKDCGVFLKKE
jgi:hypothetical protein